MSKVEGAFIVSFSFSDTDEKKGVLIVGKQTKGKVDIINAFHGNEAWDLYHKLLIKRGDKQ